MVQSKNKGSLKVHSKRPFLNNVSVHRVSTVAANAKQIYISVRVLRNDWNSFCSAVWQ